MPNVPFTITPHAVTVVVGNRPKVVSNTHPNYYKLGIELRKAVHDVDLIADLADISRFVARVTHGDVQIADGAVRWRGTQVKNVIADKLIEMLTLGYDLAPLANFLAKVMLNPLQTAIDELYLWLESGNQPITPEGNVLAFKKVSSNYLDIYSGTIRNAVGDQPSVPRETVDPDRNRTCSTGLHFCSFNYLGQYGTSDGSRIMIVEIDPADIVAIPSDYNNQKGRTWTYKVVGEVPYEDAKQFFSKTPVVAIYHSDSIDGFEVDQDDEGDEDEGDIDGGTIDAVDGEIVLVAPVAPIVASEFADEDRVVCVVDDEDGLTLGKVYTLIGGNDFEGDVFLEDDNGDYSYFEAIYFEAAETELPVEADGAAKTMFTFKDRSYLSSELLNLVGEHGQRGFSRLTGVPRSTLQGWLAKIGE